MRAPGDFVEHWVCVGCVDGGRLASEAEASNREVMRGLGVQKDGFGEIADPAEGSPEQPDTDVDAAVVLILTGGLKQVVCARNGKGPRLLLGCAAKTESNPSV
jgi:hypothetical protein